jgi:hypothetical protein
MIRRYVYLSEAHLDAAVEMLGESSRGFSLRLPGKLEAV